MKPKELDRINELARLKKTRPLTPEETAEQETLRRAYIAEWRKGAIEILEGVRIQRPDGSVVPLKKKTDK